MPDQRYRIFLTLFTLLCTVWLTACSSDPEAQLPRLSAAATILAFGDSLTYGTGADEDESYPAVLSDLSGLTVINAGVPGEVSAQGRERLPQLLDQHNPELLLLTHGGNDMLRRFKTDITRNNLESMIQAAGERNIPVLLIGVPKPGLIFLEAADFYADIAGKFGLAYEGNILASVESDNALKSDQIHPNASGYRQIANAIYKLLNERGALPAY